MQSDKEMKYRLTAKLPEYPGSPKTYPKFARTDNYIPTEEQKVRALLKLTGDELSLIGTIARTHGNLPVFRRLQVRQLSSVMDSFFNTLNFYSLDKESRGELDIPPKDKRRIEGRDGVLSFYKTSIKIYALAMDVPSPNGDDLQIKGEANYWPNLRNHITHPRTLEQYQFTGCDLGIIQAIGGWFSAVNEWVEGLRLKQIDDAKQFINTTIDELRREILSQTKKSG